MVYFQHQIYVKKKEAALSKKKKVNGSKASLITVSFKLKGSQKGGHRTNVGNKSLPLPSEGQSLNGRVLSIYPAHLLRNGFWEEISAGALLIWGFCFFKSDTWVVPLVLWLVLEINLQRVPSTHSAHFHDLIREFRSHCKGAGLVHCGAAILGDLRTPAKCPIKAFFSMLKAYSDNS